MLEELPLSRELQDILLSFPKGKAPGVDGANTEAPQAARGLETDNPIKHMLQDHIGDSCLLVTADLTKHHFTPADKIHPRKEHPG
ncbi:hypothetical protein R1sor_004640 [Riccia sorocarpa]|uniref:Uncharacterized protein n=1 Tax=Riccia sorocarpa TaxID=122646 RepID=A0ABD3HKR7_9MARC